MVKAFLPSDVVASSMGPGPSRVGANSLAVFDALGWGCFLLGPHSRVLSQNALAGTFLREGFVISAGRLRAIDHQTDRRLRRLIQSASGAAMHTKAIAMPRAAGPPVLVRGVHLQPETTEDGPRLLLLMLHPDHWAPPSCELLSHAFGLTQSEARVAIGVASGASLQENASERGIKIGTVRAYLKTIFAKTHTRSQADLTRILNRLAFFG